MPWKPCPRCHRMIPFGLSYCDDCKPKAEADLAAIRERNAQRKAQRYNRQRDPKYSGFYNSKAWKTMSRTFLTRAGYKCQAHLSEDCKGIACEVHHVKPIQTPEGWERRLDWSNLEAVCTSCHNLRHPEKLKSKTPPGVIDLKIFKN